MTDLPVRNTQTGRHEDESYFERLNAPDSEVNILMGSRSFYEGWDSNRPNVANFINIGVGTDARKWCLRHCFASSCNRSAGA